MRRGRRSSAPAAATSERLTSGIPRRAPRAGTMRAQARAISKPPAMAKPSIAAVSGFRAARRVVPAGSPRSGLHAGLCEVDLVLELARRLGAQPPLRAQAQHGLALGLERQPAQLAVGRRGVLGLDVLLVELGGGPLGGLTVDGAQAP